jgi:hypothetical protein
LRDVGWWPIQAWFWLEWGSSTAGQSLPAARSRFRPVHSDSISTRPSVLGGPCLAFVATRGKVKQKLKLPRIERGSAASMISMCGLRKSGSRKCDTCNRNPVKRELDKEPGHWAWNSFRPYLHGEAGPVRVDDWTVRDRIDFSRVAGGGFPRLAKTASHGAPSHGPSLHRAAWRLHATVTSCARREKESGEATVREEKIGKDPSLSVGCDHLLNRRGGRHFSTN